jgi:hypothetical protein
MNISPEGKSYLDIVLSACSQRPFCRVPQFMVDAAAAAEETAAKKSKPSAAAAGG